jgi:hypothetical protein
METRFPPRYQASAAWHAARAYLRASPLLATAFTLGVGLFLPGRVHPQRSTPVLSDVDSGKVQPLDLKPGCWQVRTRIVARGVYTQIAYRQLQELQEVNNITPEQRAQMAAGAEATAKSAEESAKKGSVTTTRACTGLPFIEARCLRHCAAPL